MFKIKPQPIGEILQQFMRKEGLETPLLQRRVIDAWEETAGGLAGQYTQEKFIKNQTLFVKINNPALRADLSMQKARLVSMLNSKVGAFVISDIKVY